MVPNAGAFPYAEASDGIFLIMLIAQYLSRVQRKRVLKILSLINQRYTLLKILHSNLILVNY